MGAVKTCIGLTGLACLCCVLSAARAPAQEVKVYEPGSAWDHPEQATPQEGSLLFADPRTNHYSSRAFYFTGWCRSGYCWVIHLFHWRYAVFDGWGIVVVVSDFDGHRFIHEGRIGRRDLTEEPGVFSVRFGPNLLESDGRTSRIVLAIDEFRCDLTLHAALPAWIPGDGYARLVGSDDAYMRKAVPFPLAEASGTLQIGTARITADGWAYGDRSLIVAPPGKLDSTGCAFRVFGPAWGLALLEYDSIGWGEGTRIPMLLLVHGSEWVLASRDYQLTYADLAVDPATSVAHPRRIHLRAQSRGYALEGDFLAEQLVHVSDVIDHFPGLFRGLVSVFIQRPVIFRSVGQFVGTLITPTGAVVSLRLDGQGDYFTVR
jgi:hypothetical protein